MKIISCNVAGLRACLNKGLDRFFEEEKADIYCFQESKVTEEQNPFHPLRYKEYLYPAERKGYSGTLVYTRVKPINVTFGLGIDEHDHEGRVITLEYNDFYLVVQYVPNAKRDLSRLDYRMVWEDDFKNYLKKLEESKPVVVCGDFNVAHTEMDIKNARANIGNAGFTYEERGKFTELLNAGFIDTYRYYNPNKVQYSWWSFMGHARENNVGWRIDYFIVSKRFLPKIKDIIIHDEIFGSDHCPVELVIK